MSSLYRILFVLLHYLYSLVDSIHKTWVFIRLKVYHQDNSSQQFKENYINLRIVNLNKIPSHIVIILGTEEPSYSDLSDIISWCIASGIQFISLYDHKGILKKTNETLRNAIVANKKINMEQIIWNQTFNKNGITTNGYKNGTSGKFHINILSYTDGQHAIVNAVKKLSTSDITEEEMDVEFLDNYFYSKFKLPSPDLGIVCGSLFCTYGLLPWHIRTTEFIQLDTHHNITVDAFLRILFKYAKSEQRYGK